MKPLPFAAPLALGRSFDLTRSAQSISRRRGQPWLVCIFALAALPAARAAESDETLVLKDLQSPLPAARQSAGARVMITAMTEFTHVGRKRPKVSPQAPAYYVTHSLGVKNRGEAVKDIPATAELVQPLLVRALARNGFVPASAQRPPELTVVYMWGSHNSIDPAVTGVSEDALVRNILDRAALVGGKKFAAELAKAYRDTESLAMGSPGVAAELPPHLQGAHVGIQRGMIEMNSQMSPLRLFAARSAKHQQLLDQASGDCYFVVASAYDHASLTKSEPQLLWRTRLTISARGISQPQGMAPMFAFAGAHFGRDMTEAEIMRTRVNATGSVEVGTPVTVP